MLDMFKFTKELQVVLLGLFFIAAIEVKANPVNRCTQMVVHNGFDSVMKLDVEQFYDSCENMASFFSCLNDVMREETGLNIKEAAHYLRFHQLGKALQLVVNTEELFHEICRNGSDLNAGYLANFECFQNVTTDIQYKCEEQAGNASEIFRELQEGGRDQMTNAADKACIKAAYQMGCTGANIYEKCGEEGFRTYKEIIKKIGLFKSGACSPSVMEIIKTTFINSLNLSDTHKDLYRVIVHLRRRRK